MFKKRYRKARAKLKKLMFIGDPGDFGHLLTINVRIR